MASVKFKLAIKAEFKAGHHSLAVSLYRGGSIWWAGMMGKFQSRRL